MDPTPQPAGSGVHFEQRISKPFSRESILQALAAQLDLPLRYRDGSTPEPAGDAEENHTVSPTLLAELEALLNLGDVDSIREAVMRLDETEKSSHRAFLSQLLCLVDEFRLDDLQRVLANHRRT